MTEMSISSSQSGIYKIFCVIWGENSPFSVTIANTETVDDLKKRVKEEKKNDLDHIDADRLTLYQVNVTVDGNMKKNLDLKMSEPPEALEATDELSELYEATPPKKTIHILVKVPSSLPLKRGNSSLDLEGPEAKRRKLLEDFPSVTPSSIQLKDVKGAFRDKTALNRPDAELATIPIALIHEVFSNLLHDCQHNEPTEKDNQWLRKLRFEMLKKYDSEAERCRVFRDIFRHHTDVPLHDASIPGHNTRTDGHYAAGDDFVLLTEGKNEWVGINADPQLQALAYYTQYAQDRVKHGANYRSKLPCLVVYYVGSLIGFAGAVTTSKFQFEILVQPFDLAVNEHDTLALKPLARTLGALREAIEYLKNYYNNPNPSLPLPDPSFPFLDHYTGPDNSKVKFDYQKRLLRDKLLFLGSTRDKQKTLLLKFTQKYSKEVHAYCASLVIAPELYSVEKLGGGWMMVAMEYLDEDTYTMLSGSEIPKDILRTGVEDAVSRLHGGGFVHGDIRNVNIMVRREWKPAENVKLIDFDWAGLDGVTCYPANVNHAIDRPPKARDGQPIEKEHDDFMVKHLF